MIGTATQSNTQAHFGNNLTSLGLALAAKTVVKIVNIAVMPITNRKYLMA